MANCDIKCIEIDSFDLINVTSSRLSDKMVCRMQMKSLTLPFTLAELLNIILQFILVSKNMEKYVGELGKIFGNASSLNILFCLAALLFSDLFYFNG